MNIDSVFHSLCMYVHSKREKPVEPQHRIRSRLVVQWQAINNSKFRLYVRSLGRQFL